MEPLFKDTTTLPIKCLDCGAQFTKTVGDIKREPDFPCVTPGCPRRFDGKQLIRDFQQASEEARKIFRKKGR